MVAGALTLDKSVTDADGTLNPTYAEIGDAVTYTLRVVNDNPAAAPDLVVTDVLPAEVVNCGSSCLNLEWQRCEPVGQYADLEQTLSGCGRGD